MLQKILEKPLEKKAGRNYGPPGGKTLIYFIDDINMPEVSEQCICNCCIQFFTKTMTFIILVINEFEFFYTTNDLLYTNYKFLT